MPSIPIYVLGGSQTDFARNWHRENLDIFAMFKETLDKALRETGIEPAQIEVGHVGNFVGELFTGQGLINGFFAQAYPELNGIPTSRHEAACASGSIAALSAMRDIESGHCDLACVIGLEYMRNEPGKTAADHLGAAVWRGLEATRCDYAWPHMFDRVLQEYDHRYGVDSKHLQSIAKNNFTNAKRNPNAQTRQWQFTENSFKNDDQANPVIEGRIRKHDCGQVTDGAACIFLASERFARSYAQQKNMKISEMPKLKGWGLTSSAIELSTKLEWSKDAAVVFPHVKKLMQDTLARAGFHHVTELDGMETHDCFTISEYMAIDHIGLTAAGESWQAIEDGRIAIDGDFPINASGGLIGLGHPVGATGVRMILDCSRQVSGTAGAMQIKDARNMATFNLGGSTTTCASFIVGVDS